MVKRITVPDSLIRAAAQEFAKPEPRVFVVDEPLGDPAAREVSNLRKRLREVEAENEALLSRVEDAFGTTNAMTFEEACTALDTFTDMRLDMAAKLTAANARATAAEEKLAATEPERRAYAAVVETIVTMRTRYALNKHAREWADFLEAALEAAKVSQ